MTRVIGGKYRLKSVIGRGGMGEVWSAENEATRAEVAIKILPRREGGGDVGQRFEQEAKLAAQLSHRNIVRVFDLVREKDGTLALVMERLRGETLEACLARGPLEPEAVVAIALPILSALEHAHAHGVVHRDLKPANLFLAVEADGHIEPKLLDFGIAKPPESSVHTLDGQALGTPEYMSPEQIRDAADLDGKSDVFSLAVVIYEAITGEHPFRVPTASARISAVLEATVDPHPRIPPRVWQVLASALSKRAYERPAGAKVFRERLEEACDRTPEERTRALRAAVSVTESPLVAVDVGIRTKASRRALPIAIVALLALFGVAAAALFLARGPHAPASVATEVVKAPASIAPPPPVVSLPPSASVAASVTPPRPKQVTKPKPIATTPGF